MKKQATFLATAFGISFVWFTTQFGGGFASGAQLKSYFLVHGIWAMAITIGSQLMCGFYSWYVAYYARRHQCYNYSKLNQKFYGKYAKIFAPLYELVYAFMLMVVPAVAFATGGATMEALTGVGYFASTIIIGVSIFVVALYGTIWVRRVASVLSILIIASLLVIFIPNIVVQWDSIMMNLGQAADNMDMTPFWPAIWSMVLYTAFQSSSFPGVISQHARILNKAEDAKGAFIIGTVLNMSMMVLAVLGMMAVVDTQAFADTSTPILTLVNHGPGANLLAPLISVLIILGSMSTAVNMISAAVARLLPLFHKGDESTEGGKVAVITLVLCLVGFGVAQFGLLPLINRGYSILAYLAFPVIILPYPIHMIVTNFDKKNPVEVD